MTWIVKLFIDSSFLNISITLGLFDVRSGLSAVTLDPSKSKCPGDLEICCLHPDFEKAPVGPVPAPVPIPVILPPPVIAVPVTIPTSLQPVGPVELPHPPVTGPVNPLPPPDHSNQNGGGAGIGGPNNNPGPYVAPVIIEPVAPKPYQPRCGQRHTGGIGVRIQNSKEDSGTQFGEWPNMCAVLNR